MVGLVVSLLTAVIGGQVGEKYHRAIDQTGAEEVNRDFIVADKVEPVRSPYASRRPVFGETIGDIESKDNEER